MSSSWDDLCTMVRESPLAEVDTELDQVGGLNDDERAALWLYAWGSTRTPRLDGPEEPCAGVAGLSAIGN